MSVRLRVGVVGLGDAWDKRHRPALRALSDRFEVRAVCAEVAHLAEQAAREFNAVAVDGYWALAQRGDVEAILMLSPQWYGAMPIFAACEHGKAAYCAAALDISPEEAERLKTQVDRAGIAFMYEMPRRLAPATLRLKELIATRLGKPRLLFCHHRLSVDDKTIKRQRESRTTLANRVLMELVDWCRYVVGHDPSSTFGVGHSPPNSDGDDYQMMSVDFSPSGELGKGPLAQISCGHYMPTAWQEAVSFRPPAALQVCCENGIAFIDLPSTVIWFDGAGRHQESLEFERPVGELLLSQFYRSVTSLLRSTGSLEDVFQAVKIVKAAHTSRQDGSRVWL